MSMISLRSRLSFMKGLAPSATTCPGLSASRGSPASALGDLRVAVKASPPGTPPRTSYSSRSEHPVWFPGDFAGLSHGAPSISFGAPSVDRMSIALVEGREENLPFLFRPGPTTHFLKKEQFPFPPGSQVHGTTVCDALLPHSRPRPILPVAREYGSGTTFLPTHLWPVPFGTQGVR